MGQTPAGSENYEIYVVNADGTGLRRLTRSPGPDGWPALSPDGKQILFSSVRDDCAFSRAAGCKTTGDLGLYHTRCDARRRVAPGPGQRRLRPDRGLVPRRPLHRVRGPRRAQHHPRGRIRLTILATGRGARSGGVALASA
jgi:hypothetical protein